MRVLYLSPRQCQPPVTGAKLRDYHLARALGEACDLTYIYFRESGSPPAKLPFCRRIAGLPRPRAYTAEKIVRGLAGSWPLPVLNYTSDEMVNQARDCLRSEQFDLIHVDVLHLAACEHRLRPFLGSTPVIYNWHNIESELMLRYSDRGESWAKRWYARRTATRLARVERQILQSAFGHVVCSERERAALQAMAPLARIAAIENGVDVRAFPEAPAEARRDRILFVGTMDYRANVEGVAWFVREIWPSIRASKPGLRFTIVGANPGKEVIALGEIPGVEVTGTVPELAPWYSEAFAAVIPLRIGAGTRLKILEAMAAGVPVVSSPLGAEGLEVVDGRHVLIAREQREWLSALDSLQDSALWKQLSRAGRILVCSRYDWELIGKRLIETYREWLSTPA